MDWLASIINGNNLTELLIFILIVIVSMAVLLKKGWLSFNRAGLTIGIQDKERSIIRNQLEYAHTMIEGFPSLFPSDLRLDPIHTKYVCARAEDVLQSAIVLNHMTAKDSYIKIKQDLVYNAVLKRTTEEYFRTDTFKALCYDFVEDLIKQLIKIREESI